MIIKYEKSMLLNFFNKIYFILYDKAHKIIKLFILLSFSTYIWRLLFSKMFGDHGRIPNEVKQATRS